MMKQFLEYSDIGFDSDWLRNDGVVNVLWLHLILETKKHDSVIWLMVKEYLIYVSSSGILKQ